MDWKVVNRIGIGTGIALGIGFMFASSSENGQEPFEGMSRPGRASEYEAPRDAPIAGQSLSRPQVAASGDAMYGLIEEGDTSTFQVEAYENAGTILPPPAAPQQDFLTQEVRAELDSLRPQVEDSRWQFQSPDQTVAATRLPEQVAMPVVNSVAGSGQGHQVNDLFNHEIRDMPEFRADPLPPVAASHQTELMDIRPAEMAEAAPSILEMVDDRVAVQHAPSDSEFDRQMFQSEEDVVTQSSVAATSRPAQRPAASAVPDSVAQKAAHHVEYGKSLARRGATHAARQEFYHALRLVAQSLDANTGQTQYTDALRRAIVTLRESNDFHIEDSESQMMANVSVFVEAHTCDVLTVEEASHMTSIQALQIYFAAALDNLSAASGNHVVAGEALYCLGKLHGTMARHEMTSEPLDIARAILYHRAALACDQNNYRSANELGAMLARSGQANEAIELFKQSLRIHRTPQAWHNLATVHERMGQAEFAARARAEHRRMMAPDSGYVPETAHANWVAPEQFNQNSPWQFPEQNAQVTHPAAPAARVSQVPEQPQSRNFIERVKDTIDGLR